MTQTDAAWSFGGGVGAWIFRVLLVAAAAFMVYSWFSPWWSADVAIIQGADDLVLHPWGVEAVRQVRATADPALYAMPAFFAPFTWTYFTLAMLALAVSLFLNKHISLGRVKLPIATILIGFVGLTYLAAVGIAYGIGELRAGTTGVNFIGPSEFTDAMSNRKVKMESLLRDGYWYALYAGAALFVLALVRGLFVRKRTA